MRLFFESGKLSFALSLALLCLNLGCTAVERRSLPHVDGVDWRVVNKGHIEGPGISIALMPDNGEWRKSFRNPELFVRAGLQATMGDRFWFDPTKVLLDLRGQTYRPRAFICNRETDRQFRPNPQIPTTKPVSISDEVVCVFLKYDVLPPDTKEEFVLRVEGLQRENATINVPPVRFREGELSGHAIGR